MRQGLDFDVLVELFRQTHDETQRSAAQAVDRSLVVRNWLFGWYIIEYEQHGADRAKYGRQLLAKIASRLQRMGIKGSSETRLRLYRRFYQKQNEIRPTLSAELTSLASIDGTPAIRPTASDESIPLENTIFLLKDRFSLGWSHYVALLPIDDPDARRFYEIEAVDNSWSVRELERQIASSLYERLALGRDKEEVRRLASEGQVVERASDLIKNPVVLEFLGLEERPAYSESDLEIGIIDRLQQFLLELGKGFLFEARQKRFSFDASHFRVDLVFYNRLLRCFVLIDLKLGKLSHQDLGQMQMYVNYFDRYVKTEDELPTVGILLCDDKNDAVVELTLPEESNIYASKYQLYLPSKQQLAAQLESARRELEANETDSHR